ncbi:MAG: hypothetical protein JOZ70_09345 [Pseudolabrys sp.]|nr:hypothetical protein [Pseudolabrys sp.]
MKRTTSVEPPKPPPAPCQFELPKLMGMTAQELDRATWEMTAMLIFPSDGCELKVHNKALDHELATVLASPLSRSERNARAKRAIDARKEKVASAQVEAKHKAGIDRWEFPVTRTEREEQQRRCAALITDGTYPVEKHQLEWPELDSIDIVLLPEDDPRQQWYERALAIWRRHADTLPPAAQRDLLLNRVRPLDQQLMKCFQLAQYTEGWALVEQFDVGLVVHIAALRERERAAASPANQIRGCLAQLQRRAWNAFEITLVESLLTRVSKSRA